MGYRSNGKWIIKGPAEEVNAAWADLRLNPPKTSGNVSDLLAAFKHFTVGDTGYIRFEFEDWKWYQSYSEIQWYEAVWIRLSECDGLSGKRIHIGEDDDIDENSFGEDEVEIYTSCTISDFEPGGLDNDREGYDEEGYDADGYDADGYDREGYDRNGYDEGGYDEGGYDRDGFDRNGYKRHPDEVTLNAP
jgi:hypothetical protein